MNSYSGSVAIPENCYYARIGFGLYDGGVRVEGASIGFWGERYHIPGNTIDLDADTTEAAGNIRDKWIADCDALPSYTSSVVKAELVDVYAMDTSGKALAKGTSAFEGGSTWDGTGSQSLPWQSAIVVSLFGYVQGTVVQQRGRKRGRIYLPVPSANALASDGGLTSGVQGGILDNMGTFFNDVQGMHMGANTTGWDYWNLGVVSRTGGIFTEIIQVGVGRIVDTQRRRRAKEVEAYQWEPVEHSA